MHGFLFRSLAGLFVFGSAGAFAAPKHQALFVVLGGYNSCEKSTRTDIIAAGVPISHSYRTVEKNLRAKHPDTEFKTIFGCLYAEAPPNGEGEYVTSDSPSHSQSGNAKDVLDEIESAVKKNPKVDIYLVGHSYGGWTTMYLAQELKGSPNLKLLATIDPIGPECDAVGVVLGDSACHSAPTDLDNKSIKKRAAHWVNFYQTEDSWLTSSEIAEANENHHITFNWGPHGDMDTDDGIWERIEKLIEKVF